MSNVKSCQFLSDSKDLNDLLPLYLTQAICRERGETWQVESRASLESNQQHRTKQWLPGNLHESTLLTVIHCFILFSLPLSLYPPPPNNCTTSFLSQQYCSFHADCQMDCCFLRERERRENCMTSKHEKMIENILPSAKFHFPEDTQCSKVSSIPIYY